MRDSKPKCLEFVDWLGDRTALDLCKVEDNLEEKHYSLRPGFGKGTIFQYKARGMVVTISCFIPMVDLKYDQQFDSVFFQMSFLLEGEKIISPKGKHDLVFERGDSLLFFLNSYEGKSTIYKDHLFKEIRIRLTKEFLTENGLMELVGSYKPSNKDGPLPITDKVLSVLNTLESISLSGHSKLIYLKAKILELLVLQLDNANSTTINRIKHYRDKNLLQLYSLRNYIKENLSENHTLCGLAARFGIEQQMLNHRFIKVFGISIHEFMLTEKMEVSKKLLKGSGMLIYEIADKVGYRNGTHFAAAFKRFYGLTPREYRKSL